MGDFGKATGGTSIESEFSKDGKYKVISIGSYSENSIYNDQGIRAIESDKTSNLVLNRNDLTMILNDKTTSGNIIGRVLLIEKSGIYVYNQRTERIETNLDEYDSVFLYEMLNAPNIRAKIIKQAQGNTQIYVNWTTISLLDYMIPSKEEQVKIGKYLHGISNLITLHQRKLILLNKYKRGLLFKIFTSFNRDNLISLKELIDKNVIEIKRGNIIPKQYGIYPVYSSSVHNNGLFCYSDNYMFDEELVSWSIDGGGNFFYRPKHKFSLTNVSGYIRVKDKNILNTQYLYYNLDYSSRNYNFDYQNKALPSYISKLYQIYLLDIKIQNKVSTILSSFDFIIKKEEQILLQLKQYKQGLLQQMFI